MVASFIAAAIALLALAAPAAAQRAADPDLPRADPRGFWRQVTLDPATTTSKCIGDLSTPLCAVETMVACRERRDRDMCAAARLDGWRSDYDTPVSRTFSRTRYRIVWTGRVTRRTLDEIPWYNSEVRTEDLRIEVLIRHCFRVSGAGEDCETSFGGPHIYIVRRVENGWRIVEASVADHRWERNR